MSEAPTDPQARARWAVQQEFGDIFPAFHLDAATLSRLKALLAERYLSGEDALERARADGLSSSAISTAVKNAQSELGKEMMDMLPPQDQSKLHLMLDQPASIELARTLDPDLLSQASANSVNQFLGLAQILADVIPGFRTEQATFGGSIDPQTGLSLGDEAILQEASAVFDEAGLEKLRSQLVALSSHYSATRTHIKLPKLSQ